MIYVSFLVTPGNLGTVTLWIDPPGPGAAIPREDREGPSAKLRAGAGEIVTVMEYQESHFNVYYIWFLVYL